MQNHLQDPQYEPNCFEDVNHDVHSGKAAPPSSKMTFDASNSDFAARFERARNKKSATNSAVHASKEPMDGQSLREDLQGMTDESSDGRLGQDDTMDGGEHSTPKHDGSSEASKKPKKSASTSQKSSGKKKNKKKSKRKKRNPYVKAFLDLFPKRDDNTAEIIRKIVFLISIIIIAGCLYAILNYYIGNYLSKKKYDAIAEEVTQYFVDKLPEDDDPLIGQEYEYYDYNDIANTLLKLNPDLVGWIQIEGTPVNYPVVQKKSMDPNVNTNDYYLYRAFDQTDSKPGCIFMDYRCHFDEVVAHRLSCKNSDNLLIYGHNMNNETMFGSLRNYQRNIFSDPNQESYYSKHPIVILHSLYKTYRYKIFAVFVVDGADTTSKYAFDCWNTFDFEDEDTFYEFVNSAKRRTIVKNDVDVEFGDSLLTLYTCGGSINNGKLIVMARELRPGEDPLEGTQNACLNDNILWPTSYYDSMDFNFDESKFVPYPYPNN